MPLYSTAFVAPNGTLLTTFDPLFYDVQQSMIISGNQASPSGLGGALADLVGVNLAFNPNQLAQVIIGRASASAAFVGPAVRLGGAGSGSGYHYFGSTSISYLAKWVGGVQTVFATGSGFAGGDTVRLSMVGSLLVPLLNGVADIAPVVDLALAAGKAGLSAYSLSSDQMAVLSFLADNVGGAVPGTLMMPAFVGGLG